MAPPCDYAPKRIGRIVLADFNLPAPRPAPGLQRTAATRTWRPGRPAADPPEARLLHAQVGPRARRGESPSDDTLETIGTPRVRQRFVRLDCQDLTVNNAPVCAKIETVADDRLEVVLHEPLLDQVWLRERAPDLFRRMRYLAFDNDGARFGRFFVHWSILFSRSSRSSNRPCQNSVIWLVQSISGAK